MSINLSKGQKVSLAKQANEAGLGAIDNIIVGLSWDANQFDGNADFDLDASAFLCGADGKVRNERDFIFYGNLTGPGINHMGDNTTGAGDGDDEQIQITLSQIPADVQKIAFTVTIFQALARHQNFGMVSNAQIRIFDANSSREFIHYDLSEDYSMETALVFAELYRHNGEWKFNAIGSGYNGGLQALCANYGIQATDDNGN